jgi:hypothetical protein
MPLRFDGTDSEATGAAWSPKSVVILQVEKPLETILEIEARVHEDADWRAIESIRDGKVFIRLSALPMMRIKIRGNKTGQRVRVWSDC